MDFFLDNLHKISVMICRPGSVLATGVLVCDLFRKQVHQLLTHNTIPGITCSQWPNGKTWYCNLMSHLKFSVLIITHLFFIVFV
jgi:hypothetical protein